jgi:hypothetical protein
VILTGPLLQLSVCSWWVLHFLDDLVRYRSKSRTGMQAETRVIRQAGFLAMRCAVQTLPLLSKRCVANVHGLSLLQVFFCVIMFACFRHSTYILMNPDSGRLLLPDHWHWKKP